MSVDAIRSLLTQARELESACEAIRRIGDDGKWHTVPESPYLELRKVAREAVQEIRVALESLAARDTQIRRDLSLVKYHADKGSYNGRPLDALESIHFHAEAILALLDAGVPMGGGEPACPE